ncbi:MAG: Peptidase M23 [Microgenomates group bacterium GW2011_GWF2_45_18]|nr:MAG: Peptidase M23 [Microgenomates group bacterium GW2011_GWF2_45_18]HAU99157.1 hypothetical protein [Candidatus Paceibacterota bacterium]HAX01687.1 hypothetical protein [Candidatus Paceibacterota bacterium]
MVHHTDMKFICTFLFCFFVWIFSAHPVFAYDFFDDFNSGLNPQDWVVVRNWHWLNRNAPCTYMGLPTTWHTTAGELEMQISTGSCTSELLLNKERFQLSDSYIWEFDMTFVGSLNQDRNYLLFWKDEENWYDLKFLGNTIFLQRVVENHHSSLPSGSTTYPFQPDGKYHFRNEWNGTTGELRVYIDDQLVISTIEENPEITDVQVGFQASTGAITFSHVKFDNAHLHLTSALAPLDIPYYSQRDPNWSDEEYDSASDWAEHETTIEAWGCALTSAAMILQYHEIDELPDGTEITPSSLNTWLIAQPDGYVQSGNVNWLAITRLSALYHEDHPTVPTLEFSRDSFSKETVETNIQNQDPLIGQTGGHFVVIRGTTPEHELIHDPFDAANENSEDLTTPITSLRIFTPSFTDLSGILITADATVQGSFINTSENQHNNVELLQNDLSGEITESFSSFVLKPEESQYSYQLQAETDGIYEIVVYAYTSTGSVQVLKKDIVLQNGVATITINYEKNGISSVAQLETLSLPELFSFLYQIDELHASDAFDFLFRFSSLVSEELESETRARYLNALQSYLEQFTHEFSERGKRMVEEKIEGMR